MLEDIWDAVPWWAVVGVVVIALVGVYFAVQALGYPAWGYWAFLGVVGIGGVGALIKNVVAGLG